MVVFSRFGSARGWVAMASTGARSTIGFVSIAAEPADAKDGAEGRDAGCAAFVDRRVVAAGFGVRAALDDDFARPAKPRR